MLIARHLTKSYKGRQVVKNVSVEIGRGDIVGLLGPNGAGKTTSFYMIVGIITPDSGNVELMGKTITRLAMHRRMKLGLGYLPQEVSVFRRLNVEENLLAVMEQIQLKRKQRYERMEALLEELQISHIRKLKGYALSGGESRRVEIARALALNPQFILFDEPFAGVDPIAVLDIQRIICGLSEKGIGVLITDHNVRETFGIIHRGYIMNAGGVLASGKPEELMNDQEARQVYLGESFSI